MALTRQVKLDSEPPTRGNILRNGMIAALVAAILNIIIFVVGSLLGGFPASVLTPTGDPFTFAPVAIFSIAPLILATLFYYFLSRITRHYKGIFTILALLVFLVSFASPLALVNPPPLMIILLELMHVVAAGSLFYFLLKG